MVTARMLTCGLCVKKDLLQAERRLIEAAERGCDAAVFQLCTFHFHLENLSPDKAAVPLRWLRKGAEMNCPEAIFKIGHMYALVILG
jgi:TPR repeat protein